MTLKEFSSLSYDELKKMSEKELRTLVSEMGKRLNKRMKNIVKNPSASQDLVKATKRSGDFTVKGKTHKEVLETARREQHYEKQKASTVKGAVKEQERKQIAGGGRTGRQIRKEAEQKKEEQFRAKKKNPRRALTKREKRSVKAAGLRAEKEYNKRISEAWDLFHKEKERQRASGEGLHYSKGEVKGAIYDIAYMPKSRQKNVIDYIFEQGIKEHEKNYEEWHPVETNPFDTVNNDVEDINIGYDFIDEEERERLLQTGRIPLS